MRVFITMRPVIFPVPQPRQLIDSLQQVCIPALLPQGASPIERSPSSQHPTRFFLHVPPKIFGTP
jgi:hypothetical protein